MAIKMPPAIYKPHGDMEIRLETRLENADMKISSIVVPPRRLAGLGLRLVKLKRGHYKLQIRPRPSRKFIHMARIAAPYTISAITTPVSTSKPLSLQDLYETYNKCLEARAKSPSSIEVAPNLYSEIKLISPHDTVFGMEIILDPTLPPNAYRLVYPQPYTVPDFSHAFHSYAMPVAHFEGVLDA